MRRHDNFIQISPKFSIQLNPQVSEVFLRPKLVSKQKPEYQTPKREKLIMEDSLIMNSFVESNILQKKKNITERSTLSKPLNLRNRLKDKSAIKLKIDLLDKEKNKRDVSLTFRNLKQSLQIPSLQNTRLASPNESMISMSSCSNKVKTIIKKPKLTKKKTKNDPSTKIITFNLDMSIQVVCKNNRKSSNSLSCTSSPIRTSLIVKDNTPKVKSVKQTTRKFSKVAESMDLLSEKINDENVKDEKTLLIEKITKTFAFKQKAPATSSCFYHIIKAIGKGSFGKVFLASSILTQKDVAIKAIDKTLLKNEVSRKRVLQEIAILKKMEHPNVIKLLEVFENKKNIFMVMEYISRGDLYSLLKEFQSSKISEDYLRSIFKQTVIGLQYIHSQGVLHRDIKLDNILIDNQNHIKICDFGISRQVTPGKKMSEQSGTPAFMAPEILNGEGYEGFSVDIWALGVVLYCLISGTLPFRGNNAQELNQNIINGNFNLEIKGSKDVKDLISKMLNVNPKNRITLNGILKHNWLNFVDKNLKTNREIKKNCISEDKIVEKIEGFGFERDYIIKCLSKEYYSHVNACYFMIKNN